MATHFSILAWSIPWIEETCRLQSEMYMGLCVHVQLLSHVQSFASPWTVAHWDPLSMRILQTRILEWVAMPSSRNLPDLGIEPVSLVSPALEGRFLPLAPPGKPKDKNTSLKLKTILEKTINSI